MDQSSTSFCGRLELHHIRTAISRDFSLWQVKTWYGQYIYIYVFVSMYVISSLGGNSSLRGSILGCSGRGSHISPPDKCWSLNAHSCGAMAFNLSLHSYLDKTNGRNSGGCGWYRYKLIPHSTPRRSAYHGTSQKGTHRYTKISSNQHPINNPIITSVKMCQTQYINIMGRSNHEGMVLSPALSPSSGVWH